MLYREAGQFKTTYAEDMAIFPIRQDRMAFAILLGIAFIAVCMLEENAIPSTNGHLAVSLGVPSETNARGRVEKMAF